MHQEGEASSDHTAGVPTVEDLAGWASDQGLQLLPTMSDHVAVATDRGPRQSNQDCGLAFAVTSQEPWEVLVLADGCGGSPNAADASRIAVRAAAESILLSINDDAQLAWACHPQEVAIRSIMDAQSALAVEAKRQDLPRKALRTTLICIVQKHRTVGYAHVGDGGGVLGAGLDNCQEFLVPQKSHGRNNVLRAALGPDMIGGPRAGTLEMASDHHMIIAGSDGVFDLYEPSDVLESVGRCVREANEDLQAVATGFIQALAAQTDEKGDLLASDNITRGIMVPTHGTVVKTVTGQGASQ
jgi:serine/threonine protein phosphatase PrpC